VCGVAGVLYFDGRPATGETLRAMREALAHRGPDGEGEVLLGSCGLAHRRLSIIDLSSAGHQPMASEDRRHWITYNGEVYNYLELRAELEQLGHRFRSKSDTEVILEAFRRWGTDAFSRFNGMWGLAIYDAQQRLLTLSRDRFGVKPMVYSLDGERILFASEPKALLAADPELARADRGSLLRLFAKPAYAHARSTFFEGIEVLEPGTVLELRDGRSSKKRWYRFAPERTQPISLARAKDEVRELLIDSIRLRFRSDVTVGTCLSGGVDSSSIVALSKRYLGQAPDTFTVLYADHGFDEGRYAKRMIEDLELSAHVVHPDGSDAPDVIEKATWFQDGPSSSVGVYSQWQVMNLAHGKVKVLLDGQGGDEIFGGYHSHYLPLAKSAIEERRFESIVHLFRDRKEIERAAGFDPLLELLRQRLPRLVKKVLAKIDPPAPGRPRLIAPEVEAQLKQESPELWRAPGSLDAFLWEQVVHSSLPALLHYEDRDSMAFGIEARTPFLDYRLVERAFSLPFELKLRGATTKVILREAMRGILPEMVRDRRDKLGFPTPFGRWVRGPHREWLRDLLLSKSARERSLADPRAVEKTLEVHDRGQADYGATLYMLATVELFHRLFIDRGVRPRSAIG
jgi:asparagine synthase (glutamine-hydrolysing)